MRHVAGPEACASFAHRSKVPGTSSWEPRTMANLKTIRTDVVGSLLRPPGLREERIRFDEGQISAEAMRERENEAVRGAVRLQESVGLDVISDGEIRRLNFQDSFGAAVEGFDANPSTIKSNERRVEGAAPGQRWEIKEMH